MASVLKLPNVAVTMPRAEYEKMIAHIAAAHQEIARAAGIMLSRVDTIDGDPDLEDGGDDELTGDEHDAAYVEWTTKPADLRRRGGPEMPAGHEDDEEDDTPEDDDADEEHDGCEAEEGV